LAAARLPDDCQRLARLDAERGAVDRSDGSASRGELDAQVPDVEERRSRRGSLRAGDHSRIGVAVGVSARPEWPSPRGTPWYIGQRTAIASSANCCIGFVPRPTDPWARTAATASRFNVIGMISSPLPASYRTRPSGSAMTESPRPGVPAAFTLTMNTWFAMAFARARMTSWGRSTVVVALGWRMTSAPRQARFLGTSGNQPS